MKSENRKLWIDVQLNDLFGPRVGKMLVGVRKFAFGAAKLFGKTVRSVFSLKTAVIGLATSVVGLGTLQAFAESADNLQKLSIATGDTVENLSDLQGALELNNVPADAFGEILKALGNQSREAVLGNRDLRRSFEAVGLSVADLLKLTPAQQFEQIAAGLDRFNTEQEKAAVLGRILPENYLRLLPLLGQGLVAFQSQVTEARQAGATVTEEQAAHSAALGTALTKVKISIGSVSRALIQEFGPLATALLDRLAKGIHGNRDAFVGVAKVIGESLVQALDLAIDGIIGLVELIESIPGVNLLPESELYVTTERIKRLREEYAELAKQARQAPAQRNPDGTPNLDPNRFRSVHTPENAERERRLSEQIRALEAQLEGGLHERLQQVRVRFTNDFTKSIQNLRRSIEGKPVSEDQAARAVGFPTFEEAKALRDKLTRELTRDGKVVQSVFADSDRQGLQSFAKDADDASDSLANLQDLTEEGLAPFHGDFWDGFDDGFDRSFAQWTNFEQAGVSAANTVISTGLDGLVNTLGSIVSRTQSAGDAWRAFGRQAVAALAQITTRLLIVKALQSAFGSSVQFENGGVQRGVMSRPVRAEAFAQGGIAREPTLALFGEGRQAEAFVPLPDGRTIPVTVNQMGGGAGATIYQFHIQALDGRSVERMLNDRKGAIMRIVDEGLKSRVRMRQSVQQASA